MTPLLCASSFGQAETLRELIRLGANINARNLVRAPRQQRATTCLPNAASVGLIRRRST